MSRSSARTSRQCRGRLARRVSILCLVALGKAAQAGAACDLDATQKLFADRPRPDAAITSGLQACAKAGSNDYRLFLLQGVMARDQHRLDEAAALLEKAHGLAPRQPAPALELAVTQEWRDKTAEARRLYESILASDPTSRPAQLGLARVARAQYRFEEARRIYRAMLDRDAGDLEAQNGLAWIALAEKRLAAARAGFERVLAASPGDPEAAAGLTGANHAWRYQLDLTTGLVRTNSGTSVGGGVDLLTYVGATNQVEIGYYHNSSQLPSSELSQQTVLPSNDVRIGYYDAVPNHYNWSVTYDYRDHGALPSEHWLQFGAGSYLTPGLQWFAGFRESFGASQWNSQLLQGGVIQALGDHWDIVGAGYFSSFEKVGLNGVSLGRGFSDAFDVDLNRQGPGNWFVNLGAGYSPDLGTVDVHGRLMLPLNHDNAFVFSLTHISVNNEYEGAMTFRHYF